MDTQRKIKRGQKEKREVAKGKGACKKLEKDFGADLRRRGMERQKMMEKCRR